MNYNEIILLLLLIITFVVLMFHYFINVCDNSEIKEFFEVDYEVGGKNCLRTHPKRFPTAITTKTTYHAFKNNFEGLNFNEYNYHTDYTCNARKTPNTPFSAHDGSYTKDIISGDLLLAYNCIEMRPSKIKTYLLSLENSKFINNDLIIVPTKDCILDNLSAIDNIVKKHLSGSSYGPVYVCVSQAPFLAEQKGRYDIVRHLNSCYIKPGDEEKYGGSCENKILKCEILIVKTNGEKNKIKAFVDTVRRFKSNNALCKLYCSKNPELGCGCLTEKNIYNFGDKNYDSVCLAPDFAHIKGKAPITDYSMIYFLNPHNIHGVNILPWPIHDYSRD